MKIVFFGTPDFACNVLESLILGGHEIVGVVTGEDKKVGRKQILTPPAVKVYACQHNLRVFQFHKIRQDGVETLKSLNADVFVTCAYGQILSAEILEMAKFGTINVHFSLLPFYRGSCPVQSALLFGETKTGVTIMQTDEGIDTGDIICQSQIEIEKSDNTETLLIKLSHLGASLICDVLKSLENGTFSKTKQPQNATTCSKIKKEDGLISFSNPASQIFNQIRALYVWPNAYCTLNGKTLKIFEAEVVNFEAENSAKLGEIVCANKTGLVVKCAENTFLKILNLQLEGGKRMGYKDFLNGNNNLLGRVLNGNIA